MKIRIIDNSICDSCKNKSCAYDYSPRINQNFYNLQTEATICPTSSTDDLGVGNDKPYLDNKDCVECGLCVKYCRVQNLEIEEFDDSIDKFKELSEQQLNAIVSLYLGRLFDFSANSNRNRALSFDGYIKSHSSEEAFVEIDWSDDSLECTRRIIGDIIMYSNADRINTGVIVLSNIPKMGSRDVYNLLDKMAEFPHTQGIHIYMTTISILKRLGMLTSNNQFSFSDVFYDYRAESLEQYLDKIMNLCTNKG